MYNTTGAGNDTLLNFFYYDCGTAQGCYTKYDMNYEYLISYVDRLMLLMTVDLVILLGKTFYAAQVLLKSYFEPLKERKHYNKYFILAIIYYSSAFLKYTLIEVAFYSGT